MAAPAVESARRLLFDAVERMIACTGGLTTEELRWAPPIRDANSIASIMRHALGALDQNVIESLCLLGAVERDREAEFAAIDATEAAITEHWRALRSRLDAALDALSPADLDGPRPHPRFGVMDGHELLARAVTHIYEHTGQAELTRQLLDAR
ncbi:MAG: DUF664 domain-containing protein [Dehalococcoidia bacterium]|nr:DUF664 domain-containing protein [Dehalococcoidia bacterium]